MNDALARKSQADLIIDRTAQQLGLLLKEAALELRPFPAFPGPRSASRKNHPSEPGFPGDENS